MLALFVCEIDHVGVVFHFSVYVYNFETWAFLPCFGFSDFFLHRPSFCVHLILTR